MIKYTGIDRDDHLGFLRKNIVFLQERSGEIDKKFMLRLGIDSVHVYGHVKNQKTKILPEMVYQLIKWYDENGEVGENYSLKTLVEIDLSLYKVGTKFGLINNDMQYIVKGNLQEKMDENSSKIDDCFELLQNLKALLTKENE